MTQPEVLMARRLAERQGLSPPVDIDAVVKGYARVAYKTIPVIGVDGVCLDLKAAGKKPTVILHSGNPPSRIKFTLAHELGHIIIPWHVGSVIDNIDDQSGSGSTDYWKMESEANTFAAEILMPENFIREKLTREANIAEVNVRVADQCEVSPMAAARQIAKFLDAGIVYAAERAGAVAFSGRTEGTIAPGPSWGSAWESDIFDYATHHYVKSRRNVTIHWWVLPATMSLQAHDGRDWREILNEILSEICTAPERREKLRQSINGVVAYANSACKGTHKYSEKTVASAAIQRFMHNSDYQKFRTHPSFEAFLHNRIRSLFCKVEKRNVGTRDSF